MTSVTEIAAAMKSLLTETATRVGRETGFVRRQSKLDGAGFARTTVLGWMQDPDAALSALVQTTATLGIPVSAQALDQRFSEAAATFLAALLQEAVAVLIGADPVAIPLLARFVGVVVEDSSVIVLPEALATVWLGCGDALGQHLAELKIAVRLDLLTGTLQTLVLANGRESDRTVPRRHAALAAGVLHLADLGFFAVPRLRDLDDHEVLFLSRFQTQTAVFAANGERLDLGRILSQATTPTVAWAAVIGAQERLSVRLIAARVPQEVADQRRRRLRAEARRHGRTPRPDLLALADWTILVTNVPADQLGPTEAFVLSRVRWQVECLFKLWKTGGQVDAWRTKKPWRILCEVYAKLLGALLQHWLLIVGCWRFPDRSLVKATTTLRDHVTLLAYGLRGTFDLRQVVEMIVTALATCPRMEHRAKHPATFQLLLELSDAA